MFINLRVIGIAFFFTLTSVNIFAQGGSGVEGKVVDASTNESLPFASVAVLKKTNEQPAMVGGKQTDLDGKFTINQLPAGSYTIKVTFVGYATSERQIKLENDKTVSIGTITLEPSSKVLTEVEVVGEKSSVEITPDKRIFNVDKNLTSLGGTAEALLRNVPSVTIDETGSATLRNMSATIYVNGKPTQLTLAQIPANQIASVEVISNPSARYDASTMGGIINLVLKKNQEQGFHGLVTAGVGNNSRYDATVNLDLQRGKWNFTTLYSMNSTKNPLNGYANRTIKNSSGESEAFFKQNTTISQNNIFNSGRFAADYNANDKNTFSLAATVVGGAFNTTSLQEYAYQDTNGNVTGAGSRNTVPHNDYINTGLELEWHHTFEKKGRDLRFITSVTHNKVSNAGDWFTTAYDVIDGGNVNQDGYPLTNRIHGHITGNQILAQLDYTHPVGDNAKWEIGLRSFSYLRDQKYLFNEVNGENETLLQDYSQNAQINETVNAIYAMYERRFGTSLTVQGGLRLEQSFMHGLSRFDQTKFGYDYPSKTGQNLFQSFFPTLSVNKKIDENSEWNISLSRKVGRPNFRHVFVGIQANDKQNITIGNPQIRPEFVNTAEVSYNKSWSTESGSNVQWLATAYYIYEDHTIKPVTQPMAGDSSILVTTFQNVKADIQYGVDNTVTYSVGSLSLLANFNAFEMWIQSTDFTTKMFRYNAKLGVTYKFPASISAQLTGQQRSRSPSLQGYQRAVTGADFALRKGLWQNRGSISFIINDIFNSRRFYSIYDQPLAYQLSMSRRDIRYYKLTIQIPLSKGKTKDRRISNPDIDFSN